MPRGPQGQIRPADAVGCAITVGRIAGYRQKGSGSTVEIDMAALKMSFRSLWKSSKRGNLDVILIEHVNLCAAHTMNLAAQRQS